MQNTKWWYWGKGAGRDTNGGRKNEKIASKTGRAPQKCLVLGCEQAAVAPPRAAAAPSQREAEAPRNKPLQPPHGRRRRQMTRRRSQMTRRRRQMTRKSRQMTRSRTAQAAPPRAVPREAAAPLPQATVAIIKELVKNSMNILVVCQKTQ